MRKEDFKKLIESNAQVLEQIRKSAHELHASVNQTYDSLPYGYHLDMVANSVFRYGHLVCDTPSDVLPLLFGAYYHDSIEDARLTYNDVRKTAAQFMDERQALLAAEIAYALTNDKGRTRAERAGEKYYAGIRETPHAPFVKLADRLANITHSCNHGNQRMIKIYQEELPHFLEAISPTSDDPRHSLPQPMIDTINTTLNERL